jgi:hypothetical protein
MIHFLLKMPAKLDFFLGMTNCFLIFNKKNEKQRPPQSRKGSGFRYAQYFLSLNLKYRKFKK